MRAFDYRAALVGIIVRRKEVPSDIFNRFGQEIDSGRADCTAG